MTVGVLRLDLIVPGAQSLKEKRRAVKSVKERMFNTFHVSVAEVDALDLWQRAVLGVAMVANDATYVHQCLDKIVDWVRKQHMVTLVTYDKQTV